jgi:O-antigen ligase
MFTLLLYARRNDLSPGTFGTLPLAKIVMLGALLTYLASKLARGERLTIWPLELKMMFALVALAVILLPVAVSPQESLDVLSEQFLKVLCVFILMINLITSRRRLRFLLGLMIVCGAGIGIDAIRRYFAGEFVVNDFRIEGYVGIFSDPNDLAAGLNILLPLAVALALATTRRLARLIFFACAAVLTAGTLLTFSRGGFLGLLAMGGLLVWKLSRRRRAWTLLLTVVALVVFWAAMPGSYRARLATIFRPEADQTASAQERQMLLKRAVEVAARRFIIGVGMGNFPHYSFRDKKAHNSYLEILAELGAAGLAAYLILILRPLLAMRRIEDASANNSALGQNSGTREFYYLSIGLQGAILAYLVCSFFLSLEYMWHIYYPVACAIALRQIYAHEADAWAVVEPNPSKRLLLRQRFNLSS